MAIPEFALFFFFGLLQRVVCRCVWGESESFSFPLPLLLTSQLDGGSRVLGGLESKERIMGGERERKCLPAFSPGLQPVLASSLGCHHSAKSIQKTASWLYQKRPGPYTTWLFL